MDLWVKLEIIIIIKNILRRARKAAPRFQLEPSTLRRPRRCAFTHVSTKEKERERESSDAENPRARRPHPSPPPTSFLNALTRLRHFSAVFIRSHVAQKVFCVFMYLFVCLFRRRNSRGVLNRIEVAGTQRGGSFRANTQICIIPASFAR